jgi:hypothetical protein
MLLLRNRLLLGLCVVAVVLALPAIAQQRPAPPAPTEIVSCDAFRKNDEGEWVATKDTTVPGPGGLIEIKAGIPVDEELQERLDAQCK